MRRTVILAALVLSASVVAVPDALAASCGGRRATITGSSASETLVGTSRADVITGLGGVDIIKGKGGNDVICGGPGRDDLFGGPGSDRLYGQGDSDLLEGDGDFTKGWGADLLVGGPDEDYGSFWHGVTVNLEGGTAVGEGSDVLSSVESVFGSDDADYIIGSDASNFIVGYGGNDTIYGRRGNDLLRGDNGNDRLFGGEGNFDWAIFASDPDGVSVNLQTEVATGQGADSLHGIEVLRGSQGPDTLVGTNGTNFFIPGEGNDVVDGRGGLDMSAHFFSDQPVTATLETVPGTVTGATEGNDSLTNVEGLWGSNGGDTLIGNAGHNWIIGYGGNDNIYGRAGNDYMSNEGGQDQIFGEAGTYDVIDFLFEPQAVTANLATGQSVIGGVTNSTFTGIEGFFGSPFNDSLTGDGGTNYLFGGAGNDVLTGGGGGDWLYGDVGIDSAIGTNDQPTFTDNCVAESVTSCEGTLEPPFHPLEEVFLAIAKARFHKARFH